MTATHRTRWLLLALAALLAPPLAADWLVTQDGHAFETRGTWQVKGRSVVYTDAHGQLRSLRLEEVDVEASRARTAARVEPAGEAPDAAAPGDRRAERRASVLSLTNRDIARAEHDRPAATPEPGPRIVMYSTDWCPVCRKARAWLDHLGARYVDKNIDEDPVAAREFRALGGTGVPLINFDGTLRAGFNGRFIEKMVTEIKAREAAEREPAATDSEPAGP